MLAYIAKEKSRRNILCYMSQMLRPTTTDTSIAEKNHIIQYEVWLYYTTNYNKQTKGKKNLLSD